MSAIERLEKIAGLIRYYAIASTSEAGSGHPTSALSAVELMVGLVFGGTFRFDPDDPGHPNNDRLIFSKGHATPLLYSLWAAAGRLSEEDLLTYRKFGSPLEGHPSLAFKYTEAATGSLGQGLSVGLGMALNARLDGLPYRTFVLLGDSEIAEGSQWESIQIAAHYRLDNLVGVIDVNRLGQRGETMYGHDIGAYERRVSAFGWKTITVDDGHSIPEVLSAYGEAVRADGSPAMIIARTIKGKGVSFLEDKNGLHGKALTKEEGQRAVEELGEIDKSVRGEISRPEDRRPSGRAPEGVGEPEYPAEKPVATRAAFGKALKRIYPAYPDIVALDGEVGNSTYSEEFGHAYPGRFFEMYIAEQNMVGAAIGLARRGKVPFVSTFAAFLTRAFDQIRMSQYSEANVKFVGSHAGVSIGEDGPSQMGLEDLAMFRALQGCAVLYPSDAYSTERLVEEVARHKGMAYIRTTRGKTPILYGPGDGFPIGGSKVLRRSDSDTVTVVAAGITLHEALKAYEDLLKDGISIRVIDLYSLKPVDAATLKKAAAETRALVTVEDHVREGGLGDAVRLALEGEAEAGVHSLAVTKIPKSGKPEELLDYEGISSAAITAKVKEILK
jgi:transketolase